MHINTDNLVWLETCVYYHKINETTTRDLISLVVRLAKRVDELEKTLNLTEQHYPTGE